MCTVNIVFLQYVNKLLKHDEHISYMFEHICKIC
jgi:hypothetical protein